MGLLGFIMKKNFFIDEIVYCVIPDDFLLLRSLLTSIEVHQLVKNCLLKNKYFRI